MWPLKRTIVAAVCLGWLAPAVQVDLRSVSGVVVDQMGRPVAGAAVQLENTATLAVRSFIADGDGSFYFNGLRENVDYRLRARYREMWSAAKTVSKLDASPHVRVKLVVPIVLPDSPRDQPPRPLTLRQ